MLTVNADDWGWTREITDRILACYRQDRIHRASAMTFMADSERAAELARENGLVAGLHLNITHDFTCNAVSSALRNHHRRISRYLKASKSNQVLFNPVLSRSFEYVFQAEWDEFCRLYGVEPTRLDGHLHMHLCMNMLCSGKLPNGLTVRRNFSFRPGEKNPLNRFYRRLVDTWLKSRFKCTDFFFSLIPIEEGRLRQLVCLSDAANVEIMVHPGFDSEYRYLLSDDWSSLLKASRKQEGLL